jgi:hypothetical protein
LWILLPKRVGNSVLGNNSQSFLMLDGGSGKRGCSAGIPQR